MRYDLVFEGGGAKGMVFVGALEEFEAAGHTHDRLLGTSAGAIAAALLAAGYTSRRLCDALREEKDGAPVFAGFMGVPGPFAESEICAGATAELLQHTDIPLIPRRWEEKAAHGVIRGLLRIKRYRHLFSFVERGGWFSAGRFVDWMNEKLETGENGSSTGYASMTLAEFFAVRRKELCVIASDTTGQRILVLNHRTAPDCPLTWAIRMSMGIPLVWCEVKWRAEWGRYRGRDITGHVVVDGGLLSNFPIELLVSDEPRVTRVMGARRSEAVLGFLIDESLTVPGAPRAAPAGSGGFEWSKLRTVRRLRALIDTMTTAHDKQVIETCERLVVRLPAAGFGTTEFHMSSKRCDALVAAGRRAMATYFEGCEARAETHGAVMLDENRRAAAADRIAIGILGVAT